ncbi:MAG: hypothetical protein SAK42_19570, partial [Oscillatoria sp. PMC 1076.18]|nr:hypothetical protein [Oscillatoria sp. PMC 1076.18]
DMAQSFVEDKAFNSPKKGSKIFKLTLSIKNTAKAILWEIDKYQRKSFSYRALYEEACAASEEDEKELINLLRSWREEYINELNKLNS